MAAFDIDKVVLDFLYGRLNTPYFWGGAGPYYDCSGLIIECLKMRGWVASSFDATAHDIFTRTLSGGTLKPKAHALSFYGTKQRIIHVGYCVSDTHMIEAGGGDSKTKTVEDAIKQAAFIRLRTIYHRKDFIGINVPDKSHFG